MPVYPAKDWPPHPKKSVPPLATSKRPSLSPNAPVKDPFIWPNNSLPTSSFDSVPQSSATNGLSLRALDKMNGLCHHFFTRTAFAVQNDTIIGRCHQFYLFVQFIGGAGLTS